MALIRWNPFTELDDLFNRYQRTLGRGISSNELLKTSDWLPAVDISESDEEYLIKMEVPEIRKEDIKVQVDNGILMISGERRSEKEEKNKKVHRIERSYGSFARSFSVPDDADGKRIRAEYKDGMLYLHLQKSPQTRSEKISIDVK
ncbi:MAG: Hsp20/alpha crystallin family protein [Gammaproteobacteria bacterium]|nr:Hsp20/alpha crystallin family protein [Gammaproteobacteria bacterium]